jgi:hypothetical protein
VWGSGFGIWGLGLSVSVQGLGFRGWGLGVQGLGFGVDRRRVKRIGRGGDWGILYEKAFNLKTFWY